MRHRTSRRIASPKDRGVSTFDRATVKRVLASPCALRRTPGAAQNRSRIAHTPDAVAIDARGELFVADIAANEIEVFTLASYANPAHSYAFPYAPTGVAVTPNGSDVYVTGDVPFPNGQLGVTARKRDTAQPYA